MALMLSLGALACGGDTSTQSGSAVEDDNNEPGNNQDNNAPDNNQDNNEPDAGDDPPDIPVIDPGNNDDFEPACGFEDELAPNQSPDSAADLGTDVDRDDLFICAFASDWYRFDLEAGQGILLFTEFDPRFGDLDIYLYAEGAAERDLELASSTSPDRSEFIQFEATSSGTYLLEIEGFEGAENQYRLFAKLACETDADCPDGRSCFLRGRYCNGERDLDCGVDDGFEPNESATDATALTPEDGLAEVSGASICPPDEDHYRVNVGDGEGLRIALTHDRDADLDLLLFSAQGDFFGQGRERVDGEDLNALFMPPGEYIVLVDQSEGVETTYDLSIEIEAGRCESDIDCAGIFGREICNTDDGICEGIDSEGGQGLGEICDDDGDCTRDADGCYEGTPGSGDNVCTVLCQADDECGDEFGPGAYCLIIIDPLTNTGICAPGCEDDFDCSEQLFCDAENGRCESRECRLDDDCPREDESCVYDDDVQRGGLCRDYEEAQSPDCGVGEAPDDGDNGSSSRATLLTLGEEGTFIEGLNTCDDDEDWYVVELTEPGSNLTVDVEFDGQADMDVYLHDGEGALVGAGTTPDSNPEQAIGELLAAGRYFIRVNKFPIEGSDPEVSYALSINVGAADCRGDEGACDDTAPLRITCNEETGACEDFEGNGEVALGENCDSNDDCAETADFCATFQGASEGRNICSKFCTSEAECADVPGTQCFAIRRNLGVCAIP